MATNEIKTRIRHACKTESEWSSSNPVLYKGEIAYSSDKGNKYKVGDGTSTWSQLTYIIPTKTDIGLGNVENKSSATIRSEITKENINSALGFTIASASTKDYVDSSSASAIGTGTSLVTERDIYYGLPTINNSHAYTSSTTIYAPTAGGTLGYELIGNGTTAAPTWKAPSYGSCSTEAATAAKVVSCTGFKLYTGAQITVKFTVTNTAANPTLNVNGTGAKSIYYRGGAISEGYLAANRTYTFMYNGTQYELVGDLDTNSDYKVTQTNTTTNADYRVLFSINANDNNETNSVRKSANLKFNPSTGNLTATKFTGSLAGNASSASQVYSTDTNPSSGTSYRIAFHADSSSGNKSILNNDGLKYYTLEGTTSAVGSAELGIGNSVASGTAGNKVGKIYMYGTSSGYTYIVPGYNSTGSVTITLPSSSGTLSLNGHEHNYYTLKGTNTISSTANDTTANWSGQKNSVHWYNTAGYLNSQPTTYGFLLNYSMSTDIHQIWLAQSGGNIYHRGGNANGWASEWIIVLDSNNYESTLNGAYVRYTNANGYPGFNINGDDSSWIRTTSTGIIPYQAGTIGSGHCTLGTSTWYFSTAYIDTITCQYTYTTRLSAGYMPPYDNSIGCANWFRSSGDTGWYNATYGGGWYMSDSSFIRSLSDKAVVIGSSVYSNGSIELYGGTPFIDFHYGNSTADYTSRIIAWGESGRLDIQGTNRVLIIGGGYAVTMGAGFTSGTVTFGPRTTGNAAADNKVHCGGGKNRWSYVHAASGTIQTSDERDKDIIGSIDQRYLDMYMDLKPILYRWKDGDDQISIHAGIGAQTTEKIAASHGLYENDLAILHHEFWDEPNENGRTDRYGVNYGELSVLSIPIVQNHEREIEILKSENQSLRDELNELKDMVQKLIA